MNDSELTIVELPNGAKAYLKPFISRKDYNALMQTMSSYLHVDMKTNEPMPVSLSVSYAVQEKALELLLVKVILSDGSTAPDPIANVDDMNNMDVTALFDKIDDMTATLFNPKKN